MTDDDFGDDLEVEVWQPEYEAEIVREAAWTPQIGPQLAAIEATWCDILLFGGARGGGKSDYLLGDFLQDVDTYGANWQGILFRKSYNELEEIIKRSHELFTGIGKWLATKKTWIFPSGGTLKLRFVERLEDATKYQGHSYCLAVGSLILMESGTSKKIEDIQIGDYVKTLEGGCRVTDKIQPYKARCVKVITLFGEQENPETHPFLTDSGWQSFSSLQESGSMPFGEKILKSDMLPCAYGFVRCLKPLPHLDIEGYYRAILFDAFYRFSKSFEENSLALWMLALTKLLGCEQLLAHYQQNLDYNTSQLFDDETCEQIGSQIVQDLKEYCSTYPHLYDGHVQLAEESVLALIPLLSDAAKPCLLDYNMGGMGSTQAYIHTLPQYDYCHPYTDEERACSEESVFVPFISYPIEDKEVIDITVRNANHYIATNTMIVNKNTWIGFDELGNWASNDIFKMLIGCLRNANEEVKTKRIRCSANPGGIGHHWVKRFFIDHAPMGYTPKADPDTKMIVMFIPSKVQDNVLLMKRDPDYVNRLKGVGSPELVRAWLDGDWSVVTGAYFPEFNIAKHVIAPFKIPSHWFRIGGFDWGSSKPFCYLWCAISDGTILPRGSIIVYNEYYGCSEPNKGLKLDVRQVAEGIHLRDRLYPVHAAVADPAIFKEEGGFSIGQEFFRNGIRFQRADNVRKAGWEQVRKRLNGEDGKPQLYIFGTCEHLIRTLPAIQHDKTDPEDVDTDGEDHALDTLRYVCMTRVNPKDKALEPEKVRDITAFTFNDAMRIKRQEKKKFNYKRI